MLKKIDHINPYHENPYFSIYIIDIMKWGIITIEGGINGNIANIEAIIEMMKLN